MAVIPDGTPPTPPKKIPLCVRHISIWRGARGKRPERVEGCGNALLLLLLLLLAQSRAGGDSGGGGGLLLCSQTGEKEKK